MLSEVGHFDENISYGEDRDMFLTTLERGMENGWTMMGVEDFVYYYRTHDDSITKWAQGLGINDTDMKKIRKKHGLSPLWYVRTLMFMRRPHAFIPEPIKVILRPLRDYTKTVLGITYDDDFVQEMAAEGSEFWNGR